MNKISPRLTKFLGGGDDAVYYVSHACILVRLSGKLWLFDPVFTAPPHLGSHLFFPPYDYDHRIFNVDYVIVSHQHQDHFDPTFLLNLPQETHILICEGRPQFEALLNKAGIRYDVYREFIEYSFPDEIRLQFLAHETNGIDSACVLYNNNLAVYHGNDCYLSAEKLSLLKINIDVACIPFAYIHWYPYLVDGLTNEIMEAESDRLVKKYMNWAIEMIGALKPKIAIPFGANMMFFDDLDHPVNKSIRTPLDFEEYALRTAQSKTVKSLWAGDIISKQRNSELNIDTVPKTKNQYYIEFESFRKQTLERGINFDDSLFIDIDPSAANDLKFIRSRIKTGNPCNKYDIYISCQEVEGRYIKIKSASDDVSWVSEICSEHYYHFKLTSYAFKAYISGLYTFNEIVASSRFRLHRTDQLYNLNVLHFINNIL